MKTTIGDYIGTTIGIHSPFPAKNQTEKYALAGYIL